MPINFKFLLLLLQELMYAVYLTVLKSKPSVFLNKFSIFIVIIFVYLTNNLVELIHIVSRILFVLIDSKEIALLRKEPIYLLIKSPKHLKSISISFYLLN